MITGTAAPFRYVGVNSHSRTAANAASSSMGIDLRILASDTRPSASIVASMITTPWIFAACASGGYIGRTSLTFVGVLMLLPTRTGAEGAGYGGAGGGGGGGIGPSASLCPLPLMAARCL